MDRLTEWYDDGEHKGVMVKEQFGERVLKTLFDELDEGYVGMCQLKAYEDTGLTPSEIMELKERDDAKEPQYEGDGYSEGEMVYDIWICPNCGTKYEVDYDDYKFCPDCGQRILRRNKDAETGTSVQRAAL